MRAQVPRAVAMDYAVAPASRCAGNDDDDDEEDRPGKRPASGKGSTILDALKRKFQASQQEQARHRQQAVMPNLSGNFRPK